MSTGAVIAIAVGVVIVLAAVAFFTLSRRSDVRGAGALSGETLQRDASARRAVSEPIVDTPTAAEAEQAGALARRGNEIEKFDDSVEIVQWTPPDPEVIGVSRRQFFNRASIGLMSVGIAGFASAAFVGFLWPSGTGGFGGAVNAGKADAIRDGIVQGGGFYYVPEARSWITAYPPEALPAAESVYPENIMVSMREGFSVLSQKCPHLGCRVPECRTSQWFECQCHGSQYNRAGEKKAGPAPRGMDRHPATVAANGDVIVDTGTTVPGPPIGTNTTGQEAEGPHCTSGGDH
jgi:cytochrome b6-f complex iron-sulfur subunit